MAQTIDIADNGHYARQEILAARAIVTFGSAGDTAATGTVRCLAIPAGAIVVGGHINVSNATSSNVDLHVGDGSSTARYKADVDGAATGLTALVPTGYKYTSDDTIDIMIDTAAPAASGQCELYVEYIIDGRSAFVQK